MRLPRQTPHLLFSLTCFFDILNPMGDMKRGLKAYRAVVEGQSASRKPENPSSKPPQPLPGLREKPAGKPTPPPQREDGPGRDGFIKVVEGELKGYRKAATLLLLLGKDQAAEILKHFSPQEVEGIVREIALIGQVEPGAARKILKEAADLDRPGLPAVPRQGGVDTARQMLEEAFGPERGGELFHRYLPLGGEIPFAFLKDLEYPQIGRLLKEEPPRVVSLVLSYLEPQKASRILAELLPEDRGEVISRMARRVKIAPEVLHTIEDIFRERIRVQGKVVTQAVDGANALAGILKFMDSRREEALLEGLEEKDPLLSQTVRERVFTIQDILRIPDPDFQYALQSEEDGVLAIIIKGKQPRVREKLLGNLSERRRALVEEESRIKGATRRGEVDEETQGFLLRLRRMGEEGIILIPRGNEEYI